MPKIDFTQVVTAQTRAAEALRHDLLAQLEAAQSHLSTTDWKVIRATERGIALDEETRKARDSARDRIDTIRAELSQTTGG